MCKNPYITIKEDGKILSIKDIKNISPIKYSYTKSENLVLIPCGKCSECRHKKQVEMVERVKKELKKGTKAFFITLTYDEKHLKELNKEDIQKFLKRYRKQNKCRYIYTGELGEENKRPHYHMILFTEPPKDLKETPNLTKNGFKQYKSKEIEKIWQNGLVRISKMEDTKLVWYLLKYMTKNNNKEKKEFISGWSKKPPIGIDEEKINENILKTTRTKSEKNYYKYRHKEIPTLENEIENKELYIDKIEKENKMPYLQYLKQSKKLKIMTIK